MIKQKRDSCKYNVLLTSYVLHSSSTSGTEKLNNQEVIIKYKKNTLVIANGNWWSQSIRNLCCDNCIVPTSDFITSRHMLSFRTFP